MGSSRGQETTIPDTVLAGPSGAGSTMAIRWVFPSDDGLLTRLEAGTSTLGRDPGCTAALPSASVSRRHAEIRWAVGGAPLLLDLNSTNGVFVNGQAIKNANLSVRDVVRLGDWVGIVVSLAGNGSEPWSFRELTPGYWAGPLLQSVLAPAKLVAASDLPMIIEGETGAGKEGAARAIHAWSGRRGAFVALNCAALPEALAEAELFGYRKGAFTGAERASAGYLRAAEGGTLFLDEIAELSLPIQAKLLRAVEQRELCPLGESTPIAIDVRLLAATQSPLGLAVAQKRFRGDLLARLSGLTVVIPALRHRSEEIPSLFGKIVGQCGGRVVAAPVRVHLHRAALHARVAVQYPRADAARAQAAGAPSRGGGARPHRAHGATPAPSSGSRSPGGRRRRCPRPTRGRSSRRCAPTTET